MNKTSSLLAIGSLLCGMIIIMLLATPLAASADCAPHAVKECISNIVYWYNSCGALESIYQNCNATNQICKNAMCVDKEPVQNVLSQPSKNQLNSDTNQTQAKRLAISLFVKKESETASWKKNISADAGDALNFLLVVKNISDTAIDHVSVKIDTIGDIKYTDSLNINNLAWDGDITSEVDLGAMPANTSHILSLSGTAAPQNQDSLQVTANINFENATQDLDQITININKKPPAANPLSISDNIEATPDAKTPAKETLTRASVFSNWYFWVIVIIVLSVIFIFIFRKLSSNV